MKIGKYTGKAYSDDDMIKECCFNTEDDIKPEKAVLLMNKNQCIMCALQCNFSSDCMPCKELGRVNEEEQYRDPLEVLKELKSKKALHISSFYDEYEIYIDTLNEQVFDYNGYKLVVVKKD